MRPPAGLSLLEVMLAIVILGLAIAATGELARLGMRAAGEARDLTQAQILCESKMSELAAGVIALESVERAPFELEPDWTYTVVVGPIDEEGLLLAEVTVEQVVEGSQNPASFTLTRWLLDPALEQQTEEDLLPSGQDGLGTQSGMALQ